MIERHCYAHGLDACNLLTQFLAGHPVSRNTEMQHAACDRPGLADFNRIAEASQVVGG